VINPLGDISPLSDLYSILPVDGSNVNHRRFHLRSVSERFRRYPSRSTCPEPRLRCCLILSRLLLVSSSLAACTYKTLIRQKKSQIICSSAIFIIERHTKKRTKEKPYIHKSPQLYFCIPQFLASKQSTENQNLNSKRFHSERMFFFSCISC
jgi:hypothetical protein